MFKFNRGGVDYTIEYGNGDLVNQLYTSYMVGNKREVMVVSDTDDMDSPILYDQTLPAEVIANEFLQTFLDKTNVELDNRHGEAPGGPTDPDDKVSQLTFMIETKLVFDGKHVNLS